MSTKNNVTAKISKSGKLLVSKNVKVEKISPELLPESLLNSVGLESVQDHELSNILLGATAEFEFMPEVVEAEKVLNTINIQDQQDVLNSKRYIKGIMNFSAPSEILKPCIDFLASTGGSLRLSGEKEQNNANTDGTINISYGRLNLVTSFDIDETLKYEVGILIAYDLGVPKIKIYRGAKVSACLNLCIFSAEDIVKFDIGEGVNMESVQHFLADVVLKISKVREVVERLRGILIAPQNVSQIVGSMMLETVEKIYCLVLTVF